MTCTCRNFGPVEYRAIDPCCPLHGNYAGDDYREGLSYGAQWAEQDLRNRMPCADEIARLTEESRAEHRGLRAFYLGALRAYRSITRTQVDGRWGT